MKKKIRNFISNKIFMHLMVLLGLAALWGFIAIDNKYFLFFIYLSIAGVICGSFIRIIDKIK